MQSVRLQELGSEVRRAAGAVGRLAANQRQPEHHACCYWPPTRPLHLLNLKLSTLPLQEVHRISLKKLPVKVVKAADGSDPEAAGGQPDAQPAAAEHQQQQQEEQQQGGSGDEEGEESGSGSDGEQPFGSDVEEDGEDGSDGDGEEGGIGSGSDDDGGGEDGSSGEDEEEGDEEEEEEAAPELDAFSPGTAAAVEAFATAVEADPAAFLQPAPELAVLARGAAKALYDYQAALEGGSSADAGGKSGGKVGAAADAAVLPELYVEGFDAEQIWLQVGGWAGRTHWRACS